MLANKTAHAKRHGQPNHYEVKVSTLNEAINKHNSLKRGAIDSIYELMVPVFKDSSSLAKHLSKLQNDPHFYAVSYSNVDACVYFSHKEIMPREFESNQGIFLEVFNRFLEEYGDHARYESGELFTACGPCIIINTDGDVIDQDSGRCFLKKSEYESEEERNEKIEQHMEKTGHFPNVFEIDRFGGVELISTIAPPPKSVLPNQ